MKSTMALLAFLAMTSAAQATSPVSKVFQMLGDLESKIIKEGEAAQKAYDEFSEWCEDRSKNVGFEIKTGNSEVDDLNASIEKSTAQISAFGTKIEELSGSIAKDEADLQAATGIRGEEAADFKAESTELKEVISSLERAIAVLNREMAKSPAAMLQFKSTADVAKALGAMVQASMLSSADASRLTALVQTKGQDESDEDDSGAPAAAAYKSKSGGIVEILEDLLEKAAGQLETAQKTEQTSKNNFAMLKQSLEDEIKFANKDMTESKDGLASSQEAKATAEGDLSVTTADLKEDTATLKTLHQDCMKGADEFQAETKSRGEELGALAQAKKILNEALGAAAQSYGAALDQVTSFLQLNLANGADLAKFEAVRYIRDLARKENSVALAQLASKMSSAIRFGESSGSDPFGKVKGLISDMIATLEKDAASEATQKAYCDKETAETKQGKLEKEYEISKLSTKIDSMSSKSAKLKEQAAEIQKELAALASSQAEMDKIRSEEKGLYDRSSAEMKQGIEAVKKALSVLRDYYAQEGSHGSAGGAGGGIVSMLEVVESDFTKGLADMEVAESSASTEYEKVTYMNKVATTSKSQDVKYKTKEATGLDKSVSEAGSDREGIQAELDALMEYLEKLNKMCVAKAEPYAERKARRAAEVAGLKEALQILDGEAVLIQQHSKRSLRGH